ncbi:MAG: phosphoribosylglycinamide formyltransferase, partial [Gallionellaceae bacterium]|nr:phosphoribosylglycinamide formyltransferase [Gallionellaceae bacterium]
AVISSKADTAGLDIARQHGIPAETVTQRDYPDRTAFDAALAEKIDRYQPDLVALAGFMRILTPDFVSHYQGRLINIHPSLLPAYSGLNTHERALADGVKIHGCTVHFVTSELDCGPIIVQAAVPVMADDTPDSLSERVLRAEHQIYPQAVRWFCEDRLQLSKDGKVSLDGMTPAGATLIYPPLDQEINHV